MNRVVLGFCLVGATLLVADAGAWSQDTHSISASSAVAKSPYATIVARNLFGLLPIQREPPAGLLPPEAPPKITPTGAMNILGKGQALFQVANKPKSGQPTREDFYVLAEGECQDGITVVKINLLDGIITFDNHGITQELALVPAKGSGSSGGLGGGATPGPGHRSGAYGLPNPSGQQPGGTPVNANGVYQPVEDSTTTADQSVILIEAQRMKALQSGNDRLANLFPPTPLTRQNMQENGPGAGVVPK